MPPSVWHNPVFVRVWLGQTASIFGDRVTDLALPWLVLQQTHSPFDAALVAAARYVPMIAFGLAAGVVADRIDRRRMLVAADMSRAVALGVIVLLAATGHTPVLWVLAAVVFVLGLGQIIFQAAYYAWLPDVAGGDVLDRATAALEASDATSTIAGPSLGGALIQVIGPALALGADAISYVVSAASIATTPPVPSHATLDAHMHPITEALEGVRYLLRDQVQRLLRVAGTALYASTTAIGVLLATLAQLRLHLPAWQAGIIFAAAGIGGLVGSWLAPRVLGTGWRRALALSLAVCALGIAGLALATLWGDPAGGFVLGFFGNLLLDGATALCFIITGTVGTRATPRELRGRANAASSLYSAIIRSIGVVLVGAIVSEGSLLAGFGLIGILFVVAAIIMGQQSLRGAAA